VDQINQSGDGANIEKLKKRRRTRNKTENTSLVAIAQTDKVERSGLTEWNSSKVKKVKRMKEHSLVREQGQVTVEVKTEEVEAPKTMIKTDT
jgi:hypothetical protein